MLTTSDVPGSKRKLLCALLGPTSIITFTVCDPTLRKRICVLLWAATIPAIARNKNATTFVIFRIEPPRGGLWAHSTRSTTSLARHSGRLHHVVRTRQESERLGGSLTDLSECGRRGHSGHLEHRPLDSGPRTPGDEASRPRRVGGRVMLSRHARGPRA